MALGILALVIILVVLLASRNGSWSRVMVTVVARLQPGSPVIPPKVSKAPTRSLIGL